MYVTVNLTYRNSVSQKKLNVWQRDYVFRKNSASQKTKSASASHKKKCLNWRLTNDIYLNSRLTKEIGRTNVSQKKLVELSVSQMNYSPEKSLFA